MEWMKERKSKCHLHAILIVLLCVVWFEDGVFAGELSDSHAGREIRHLFLKAVREAVARFPDAEVSLADAGFTYLREDVRFTPGEKVHLDFHYLRIVNEWAWIEATEKNVGISIDALLYRAHGQWKVKGLVRPEYLVCMDAKECLDVKAYMYGKIHQKIPAVPGDIFPELHPERLAILHSLKEVSPYGERDSGVFVVKYLGIKGSWAWIETDLRSSDGMNQFEPLYALCHKRDGKWSIVRMRPCCGDCEDDPECRDLRRYYKKLRKEVPGVPRNIFPQ